PGHAELRRARGGIRRRGAPCPRRPRGPPRDAGAPHPLDAVPLVLEDVRVGPRGIRRRALTESSRGPNALAPVPDLRVHGALPHAHPGPLAPLPTDPPPDALVPRRR